MTQGDENDLLYACTGLISTSTTRPSMYARGLTKFGVPEIVVELIIGR